MRLGEYSVALAARRHVALSEWRSTPIGAPATLDMHRRKPLCLPRKLFGAVIQGVALSALDAVRGRILDVDSHEYIPSGLWATEFGAECGMLADFWESQNEDSVLRGRMSIAAPVKDDLLEISESTMETAWQSGSWAPSAIDMARRPELLDFLGVSQQMIFPNVIGTVGLNMLSGSQDWIHAYLQTDLEPSSVRAIGCVLLEAWNKWVIETASSESQAAAGRTH